MTKWYFESREIARMEEFAIGEGMSAVAIVTVVHAVVEMVEKMMVIGVGWW